jgi:hypothetical protein
VTQAPFASRVNPELQTLQVKPPEEQVAQLGKVHN